MRQPQIFASLGTYSHKLFLADMLAGITVAMVAIPLSLCIGNIYGADIFRPLGRLPGHARSCRIADPDCVGNMAEPHKWRGYLALPRSEVFLLFLTLALTVLVDLTVAIGVGVALGLALRLREENSDPEKWDAPKR